MSTITCAACGTTYGIGASPWCRDAHARGGSSIEDVTWPGGRTFENMGHELVICYSPAEYEREMKARGLEPFVRHTTNDQHVRSWATMDAQTLENARVLAERQAHTKASGPVEAPLDPQVRATTAQVFQELASR